MRSVFIVDGEPSAPLKHRTDCRILALDFSCLANLMVTFQRFGDHALYVRYTLLLPTTVPFESARFYAATARMKLLLSPGRHMRFGGCVPSSSFRRSSWHVKTMFASRRNSSMRKLDDRTRSTFCQRLYSMRTFLIQDQADNAVVKVEGPFNSRIHVMFASAKT